MILFLKKVSFFVFIFLLIFLTGIILPTTPRSSTSLLFGKYKKDSLLVKSPSPRIIFIGGSGLSFGLDSKLIKDSLGLNPINTAIHIDMGLFYMMKSVYEYIRPGDIIVIAPEYQLFYGRRFYGGEELLRTVLDVSPKTINLLSLEAWRNIFQYLPGYSFSKFKLKEYFEAPDVDNFYGRNSFNDYGDEYKHWSLGSKGPYSYHPITESFNPKVITELKKFRNLIKEKRALLYITFPGLQASSFDILIDHIRQVETELHNNDFSILGSPQQFKIPDSLVFDAPYHLTKNGLDLRTQLLIEDLRNSGIKKFIQFTKSSN